MKKTILTLILLGTVGFWVEADNPSPVLHGSIDTGVQVIHSTSGTSFQLYPYLQNGQQDDQYPGISGLLSVSLEARTFYAIIGMRLQNGVDLNLAGETAPSGLVSVDQAWFRSEVLPQLVPGLWLAGGTRNDFHFVGLDDAAYAESNGSGLAVAYLRDNWSVGLSECLGWPIGMSSETGSYKNGPNSSNTSGPTSAYQQFAFDQWLNGAGVANGSNTPAGSLNDYWDHPYGDHGFGIFGPLVLSFRYTLDKVGTVNAVVGTGTTWKDQGYSTIAGTSSGNTQALKLNNPPWMALDFYHLTFSQMYFDRVIIKGGFNATGLADKNEYQNDDTSIGSNSRISTDVTVGYKIDQQWACYLVAYDYLSSPGDKFKSYPYVTYKPIVSWISGPVTTSAAFQGETLSVPDWQVQLYGRYQFDPHSSFQAWFNYDSNLNYATTTALNMNAFRINADYVYAF